MASVNQRKEPSVNQSHYHSRLFLCLVLSVAICTVTISPMTIDKRNAGLTNVSPKIQYIAMYFCVTILLITISVFLLRLLWRRDIFHRKQEIFWPFRCGHCARALSLLQQTSRNERTQSEQENGRLLTFRHLDQRNDNESGVKSLPNGSSFPGNPSRSYRTLQRSKSLDHIDQHGCRCSHSSLDSAVRDGGVEGTSDTVLDHSLGLRSQVWTSYSNGRTHDSIGGHFPLSKIHKSPLYTFYIFIIITAINIPINTFADLTYLTTLKNFDEQIDIVLRIVRDFTYLILIFLLVIFFRNFYDAKFVDEAKFSFPLALIFGLCFWIAATKILYPVIVILNSQYSYYPNRSGLFWNFFNLQVEIINHFYAEALIMCAANMWKIWSSMVPKSCLRITQTQTVLPELESLGPTYFWPFLQKLKHSLKKIIDCRSPSASVNSAEEGQSLLLSFEGRKRQEPTVNIPATAFLFVLGITYFSLFQVLEHSDLGLARTSHSIEITRAYLKWFLEIIVHVPLLALYRYRMFLTDSFKTFHPQSTVSLVSGLIGGHDLIIFTSCVGIFTLNILRFISAVGILCQIPKPPEDTVLASFALVFAIFQIYSTWVMTFFLAVVQRQDIRSLDEAKWTLICLIYTAILNATQWLVDSVDMGTRVELTAFLGRTEGEMVAGLLEPLVALYGIHSAMIAYEAITNVRNYIRYRRENEAETQLPELA